MTGFWISNSLPLPLYSTLPFFSISINFPISSIKQLSTSLSWSLSLL
jgi:hypothetical protein